MEGPKKGSELGRKPSFSGKVTIITIGRVPRSCVERRIWVREASEESFLTEKAEVAGELDAGPGVTVQLVGSLQGGLEALGLGRTHSFVRIELEMW